MADAVIHEKQAKHNYSLLKELQGNGVYQDWQLTIAFYTALHIVDCALARENPDWRKKWAENGDQQTGWHAVRKMCVNSLYRDIYKNYRFLYEKSMLMRYLEGYNKKATDIISQEEAKRYAENHLGAILKKFGYSW